MSLSNFLMDLWGQPDRMESSLDDPESGSGTIQPPTAEDQISSSAKTAHLVARERWGGAGPDLAAGAHHPVQSIPHKAMPEISSPDSTMEGHVTVPENSDLFAPQPLIPLQLSDHPLILLLNENGLCDLLAEENQVMLPIESELAAEMHCSMYAEMPVPSYIDGVRGQLERVWQSPDRIAAENGEKVVIESLMARVRRLRKTLKAGLVDGQVFVAE